MIEPCALGSDVRPHSNGGQSSASDCSEASLVQGNDIEDQFADAVKLALETGGAVSPSPEMTTDPAQVRGHRRAHRWLMAFMFTVLTATVAILVFTAFLR